MKLFIAFFAFFALCAAQSELIQPSVISPDFLFKSAWESYEDFISLQAEIDDSMRDAQLGVSMVLKSSTNLTLEQYQNHITSTVALYASALDGFKELKPGQCKSDSEESLRLVTSLSGNRISNCANTYNRRVSNEISSIDDALSGIESVAAQVQTIITKSFIGCNAFENPEAIETRFTDMYEVVRKRWENSRPNLESIRLKLENAISIQNSELSNCHNISGNWARLLFEEIMMMIEECREFDGTVQESLGVRGASRVPPSIKLREKIEEKISKIPEYQWKV